MRLTKRPGRLVRTGCPNFSLALEGSNTAAHGLENVKIIEATKPIVVFPDDDGEDVWPTLGCMGFLLMPNRETSRSTRRVDPYR
jgi:hypothetical protein